MYSTLLPPAFSAGPRPRLARNSAFDPRLVQQLSPPISPPTPIGVDGTSRRLQAMLGTESRSASDSKSPKSPSTNRALHSNSRIQKRPPPRSRGLLKRRRDEDDDRHKEFQGHGYGLGSRLGSEDDSENSMHDEEDHTAIGFSTPKRRRRGPLVLPLGMQRKDFLDIDEGLDDAMAEDLPLQVREIDEGYGSMETIPSHTAKMLEESQMSEVGAGPGGNQSTQAVLEASDPMSLSTPSKDLAALALSPHLQVRQSLHQPYDPGRLESWGRDSSTLLPGIKVVPPYSKFPVSPPAPGGLAPPTSQQTEPSFFATCASTCNETDSIPTLPQLRPLPSRLGSRSYPRSDPITPSTPPSSWSPPTSPSLTTRPRHRQRSHSWTHADDSALVDLVLEKLKLNRGEWAECARVLGCEEGCGPSLGRRWKELVGEGCVGMKYRFPSEDGRGIKGWGRRATAGADGKGFRKDVREVQWQC